MRMRTINWGEGPVKVGLYKGETICPKCQSVVGSDKNKLRGPGCTTCDPDQAIDSVAKYEVVDTDAVETEAVVRFFLTEAVDPVEPGDMDVVMDADEMTEAEVQDKLVLDESEIVTTDIYKTTRIPVAIFQSAERALMKMAPEDFSHAA